MQYYRRKPLNLTTVTQELLQTDPASLLHGRRPRPLSPELETKAEKILVSLEALAPPTETSTSIPQMADPTALLQQAADILQQEIASSLPTIGNSGTIGSRSSPAPTVGITPDLLTNVHQFVDQLAQVIGQRCRLEGTLPASGPVADDGSQLPLLRSPSVQPGETANLSFKVHNDSNQSVETRFFGTDLVSSAGDRIPGNRIIMTPQRLVLSPDQIIEVSVRIEVPLKTPANIYFGQVIASNLSDLAAVVRLTVR